MATTEAATGADLSSVHDPRYVELVRSLCASLADGELASLPTGDTIVGKASYEIATLAADAAVEAARAARLSAPLFAVTRPPGHHAEPARGMGFCVFNNVALAAAWGRRHLGPVLIADFDYHHGNGTQAWVERELEQPGAPLGFISTHAYPAYPGTGAFRETRFADNGCIVDIPLPLSTATDDFIAVWSALLPVLAARIEPKLILVSAGFDMLAGDPIAGLPVGVSGVTALCGLLARASATHAAPLALVLEGGYSLENMRASGRSVAAAFARDDACADVPPAGRPADAGLARMVSEIMGIA